jgi:uroporphyrin-III C-methyltransferase/precorrin-2 dehydrogenase/sirohydrochlorin ferrochelatase
MTGRVFIVGAGPGDPGLLTRRAAACLRKADLVLFDALVDERVVRLARRAQRFFVGKRAGRQALAQEEIQQLMVRAARRGKTVVRLKGGDPFVFGRGGEEALALRAANVPYEVVPGLSSAVAAPAMAGIPVTHRGLSSGVLVLSGHDDRLLAESAALSASAGVTLVVLMGLGRRREIGRVLIERGWLPETPAAVITDASLERQQTWRGSLHELTVAAAVIDEQAPGTLIIGAVARLDLTQGHQFCATDAMDSGDDAVGDAIGNAVDSIQLKRGAAPRG